MIPDGAHYKIMGYVEGLGDDRSHNMHHTACAMRASVWDEDMPLYRDVGWQWDCSR